MIGRLRHRLVLERPVRSADGGGGAETAWETAAIVWAAVEATDGGERDRADRSAARTRIRVRLRFRSDVTADMRFRDGDRLLNIRAVLDGDGRRRWLTCLCEEGGTA